MKRHLTNKEIEDISIAFVMSQYRGVKDVRKRDLGYDLRIGNKLIEVKGTAKSKMPYQRIFLSGRKEHEVFVNNQNRYWIYRVIGVGTGQKRIIPIEAKQIIAKREARWRAIIKKDRIRS